MYTPDLNTQNLTSLEFSRSSAQQEVRIQENVQNQVGIPQTLIIQGGGIIAFIVFWTSFLMLLSKITKGTFDNNLSFPVNSLQTHRCTKCQYFSRNHLLNCAVQPAVVMTEEAKYCSDFYPSKINSRLRR
ncbi:MAG: hypothetical protein IGS39_04135 [Calothrix sp. C42_A2020_038]|nr:hypothetical protein [Calothrix sp. C42_A2020_038]